MGGERDIVVDAQVIRTKDSRLNEVAKKNQQNSQLEGRVLEFEKSIKSMQEPIRSLLEQLSSATMALQAEKEKVQHMGDKELQYTRESLENKDKTEKLTSDLENSNKYKTKETTKTSCN